MSAWYIIKVLPGKERQLTEHFNQEILSGKLKNIIRFVCPTEKDFVLVRKKKVLREKVIYTGYLYFESPQKLTDDELKYISGQQLIMGILGDRKPVLLNESDIKRILKDEILESHIESKKTKYSIGDEVILTQGSFNGFKGKISSIKNNTIDVEVPIFGRPTNIKVNIEEIVKV